MSSATGRDWPGGLGPAVTRNWWTLLVSCAATFMLLLDVTIVIVALPEIQRGLGSSYADVQWVVDAYALTLASFLLAAGSLADRYGRRRLFVTGLAVFTGGSLLCGLASSPLMLICSRSAQGVGGAILFATSLALLAQSFQGKQRGVAFAIWGTVTAVATALGPILGGLITSGISWRGIFLVNLPIGAAAIAVTLWQVGESRAPHAHRPDWPGFVSLTAGLVSLVYGLIRAGETGWSDPGVLACLCLAAVFLAGFAVIEHRSAHPLFDLSLFTVPAFGGGLIAAFCMNGSLFAMLVYLVLYLQDDLGYSALQTGVRLLLITGGTLLPRFVAGRLSSRIAVRWLIGPGLALVGVGLLAMSGLTGSSSWTHLAAGFVVAGIGSGLVNPPLASTAVGVVTPQRAGMASGVNTTFRQLGIAVSIATFGTIYTASLRDHLANALTGVPALARRVPSLVAAVQQGNSGHAMAAIAPSQRGRLAAALHASSASALNDLLVVGAVIALAGAVFSLILIRPRDFVPAGPPRPPSQPGTQPDPRAAPAEQG
jgi:EmrB/QacA subfamily drug resistance transporter